MKFYVLEIQTFCGLAYQYGEHGPYIYTDPNEAREDLENEDEEGVIEAFLYPDGSIDTENHDWEIIQEVMHKNNFRVEKFKDFVKDFLLEFDSNSCKKQLID